VLLLAVLLDRHCPEIRSYMLSDISYSSAQCNELHSFKSVKKMWFCFIYQNINTDAFNSCVMAVKEITKAKSVTNS